jgi:hypothetical protein
MGGHSDSSPVLPVHWMPLMIEREMNLRDAAEACGAVHVLRKKSPVQIGQALDHVKLSVPKRSGARVGNRAMAVVAARFAWPQLAQDLVGEDEAFMVEGRIQR